MLRLRLLRALRGTLGLTAADLARALNVPVASVRRSVSELRAFGVPVVQSHGFYRLQGE